MSASRTPSPPLERAVLVGVATGGVTRDAAEISIDELRGLARAAGAHVVSSTLQERRSPDPATFIGKGKMQGLAVLCAEQDVTLVIVDNELTPSQRRHLGDGLQCRVIDRTQLILDIFALRARTSEGKRQVELAQLRYLLPRLAGSSAALSRLGGGIGTRGPGETKLETDRRRIRARIEALQREIDSVQRRRAQRRDRRHKESVPTVALVGYTNAGKTTLFNRLTREGAVASDALFVTLDPLTRRVRLPGGGSCLVSDTVGFVDRLPHALVAAFRATLEEVVDADLLLHVVDASGPDRERQISAVRRVLDEVGASGVPIVDVLNKIDRLGAADDTIPAPRDGGPLAVSARTGAGVDRLMEWVASSLGLDTARVTLTLDLASPRDRETMAVVCRAGRVVHQETVAEHMVLEADVPRRLAVRLSSGGTQPPSGASATNR
jgi:GTP-binding protein HflX